MRSQQTQSSSRAKMPNQFRSVKTSLPKTAVIFFIAFTTTCCCVDLVNCQDESRTISYDMLLPTMDNFTRENVVSFTQLLFDIPRYQLIVGSRDYLYRLSLEGLRTLEETYWPSAQSTINMCRQKGQTQEDCHNFIRVLLIHNNRVFACGTNAFSPECTWRDINSLSYVFGWEDGVAKCPYSPHTNSTALMTAQGDYYIASALDFSSKDYAICRIMGKEPYIRTVQYDAKSLNEPSFIASYDIGNFTYFLFREVAVEYINCGKAIYSRIGRMCKNDQGGEYILKDNWTTFLKARLNCSIPGPYPFYFNEIQGVHYIESDQMMYATFTTPENSIYGSAICAFNFSAVEKAFNGPLKYQSSPRSAWERKTVTHKLFQCQTPEMYPQYLLDAEQYQLTDDAVQPVYSKPVYTRELERLSVIVADVVKTNSQEDVHVLYVATFDGVIRKLVVSPDSGESCLIEELHIFPDGVAPKIRVLKLLKDTSSLYVGTDTGVLRVPLNRCKRFKSKTECLNSMDPYCGWNEYQMACTTAPHRNPASKFWSQKRIQCRGANDPVDGGWSPWSPWFKCAKFRSSSAHDGCWCQQRLCNRPTPVHGGNQCEGASIQVSNCTRHGRWTEWSEWSSCSQTCGPAVRSRRRSCGNPSPAYGGLHCEGLDREEDLCTENPPCPDYRESPIDGQWSEWGPWSECSVFCGGGFQHRERRCNDPVPAFGGKECAGCNKEFRTCQVQLCPEQRKSAPWTPWLRVNNTKDGYFEQRFRMTCRANVPDPSSIRIGHMKKEERFCLEGSQSCVDSAFLSTEGEWSPWSDWSPCSAACGKGSQYRERTCDNPPFSGSGSDCKGSSRMEQECETIPCDDSAGWEAWTVWSMCDFRQEQHRRRKCKIDVPGPQYCVGASRETRLCVETEIVNMIADESRIVEEDGVHMEHVIVALIGGLVIGLGFGAFAMYIFKQRKIHDLPGLTPRGTDANLYVSNAEWKSPKSIKDTSNKLLPNKEATIKRSCNGTLTRNLRTPLYSEESFRE